MLRRKQPVPDEDDLLRLKKEAQTYEQVEQGLNTPFGKYILGLIEEYKNLAVKEFTFKDISEYADLELLSFFMSIRGKLQILNNFEKQLLSAKENKETIIREVNKYSA